MSARIIKRSNQQGVRQLFIEVDARTIGQLAAKTHGFGSNALTTPVDPADVARAEALVTRYNAHDELVAERDALIAALEGLLPAYREAARLLDPNHDDALTSAAHNALVPHRRRSAA